MWISCPGGRQSLEIIKGSYLLAEERMQGPERQRHEENPAWRRTWPGTHMQRTAWGASDGCLRQKYDVKNESKIFPHQGIVGNLPHPSTPEEPAQSRSSHRRKTWKSFGVKRQLFYFIEHFGQVCSFQLPKILSISLIQTVKALS